MEEASMFNIREQFLVDENDNRIGVLLSIEDYQRIIEELEELESIRAYDEAKASAEQAIPFEPALAEIERSQKK